MSKFLREITQSIGDLVEALMRAFGYEPEAPDFENQLRALFPTQTERDLFRDGALMLAQVGVPTEQFASIAVAFARGVDTTVHPSTYPDPAEPHERPTQ